MNILYIDIDSLRPDHLSCYGYHRKTSPNIDAIASEGLRFTECYTPDAPCLPSRTAMTTGRFGIHTGVVNHGGVSSVPFNQGPDRGFSCALTDSNWATQLQKKGYHTVAFSPFAQRHGAWHWYAGFMEMHNTGGDGLETANSIAPQVNDWLEINHNKKEPFFMWLNVWDPHTPYRTPVEHGNPFAEDPLPEWYNEGIRSDHWKKAGPHSAQEVNGFDPRPEWIYQRIAAQHPSIPDLQPHSMSDMQEVRKMFDGYDMGVHYADMYIGQIIDKLKSLNLYEKTAIIISSDHGENLGELWVYGDHQTADKCTHNIPMIIRWPDVTDQRAGETDDCLLYNIDIAASTLELSGIEVPSNWDGRSIAKKLKSGEEDAHHRDSLVLSQLAWCAQRSVRWKEYLCIQTYHDGFHDYPDIMVFDLTNDPHEQYNIAEDRPDLVEKGKALLWDWHTQAIHDSNIPQDPLLTVIKEGGPLHIRDQGPAYMQRLRETGRKEIAARLELKHGLC